MSDPSYRKKASAPTLTILCPPDGQKHNHPEQCKANNTPDSDGRRQSFNTLKEKIGNKLDYLRTGRILSKGQTSPSTPKAEMPLPTTVPHIPPPRPPRNKFMTPLNELFDILWSVEDYTLKEFFTSFESTLPQVVMVTEGHYGEEELDTFGKEQVLLIKGFSRQRRVIAEDDSEAMYSIPIQYPISLQVLDQGENSGNACTILPIAEIQSKFPFPVKVKFVENSDDKYFYSKTKQNVVRMGEIRLVDVYEETYFLSHAVSQGTVFDQVLLLPLYLPLTLAIAEGFKPTLALDWPHYFKFLRNSTAHINYEHVYGNKDISAYSRDQIQSDDANVYEFLQPTSFLKYESIAQTPRSPIKRIESIVYEDLPSLPPRSPTTPKQQTHFFVDLPDIGPKPVIDQLSANTFNTLPQGIPRPIPLSPGISKFKGNTFLGAEVAKVLPLRRVSGTDANEHMIPVPDYNAPSPGSPGPLVEGPITRLNQIPEDVSLLNTSRLCECLKLLNLHKYVPTFIDHQIDGMLLKDLDMITLHEDLGMNRLEATKIRKFAHGWRPK